jgi:ABC-type transporter Mla maintaining outer membrane lipid asymmetry ATPase subunit MlaF
MLPAVAVAGLNVSRGDRRALHGLDFSVARGPITGLLGASGCGKTMALGGGALTLRRRTA